MMNEKRVSFTDYAVAILLLLTVFSVQASSPELAKLDRLVAEHLQVEKAIINLQTEAQQAAVDNERLILLYKQEQKALEQSLTRQKQQQDDVAEQRSELLAAQVEQEQKTTIYQQQLDQTLVMLSTQWQGFPPPLQLSLQDTWGQLQNTSLGLSDRFTAMIDILTRLESFNSSINFHQGILDHEGQPWQAKQLFIGLAQGYYRLPDGSGVGVGHSVDGVWQWQSLAEMQPSINKAFDIYQGHQKVAFVELPLSSVRESQP